MPRQTRLRLTPGRYDASEEQVQQAIQQALLACRYRVLSTVHRYRRQPCPECGQMIRPSGGIGATPGVPDLLVSHDAWGGGGGGALPLWAGIEVKGPRTRLSPEQEELEASGRIVVVRSWREAVEAVQAVEREAFGAVYGVTPNNLRDG